MPKQAHADFLKAIRNHRELSRVFRSVAPSADLSWFDAATATICKHWLQLAGSHFRAAKSLSRGPHKQWRATVSRCYYSIYNASRSVRYYVKGFVSLDVDDHKLVGDLPDDFPDHLAWSNFATELRRDRNVADYEPWATSWWSLTFRPEIALHRTDSVAHMFVG